MTKLPIITVMFIFTIAIFLLIKEQTHARPSYGRAWKEFYPKSLTDDNLIKSTGNICQLCHAYTDGGDPWNEYGWKLRQLDIKDDPEKAFKEAEDYNSDRDINSQSNIEEINNHKQPGWKFSKKNKIHYKSGTTKSSRAPSGLPLID